jgi:hypothetical protein
LVLHHVGKRSEDSQTPESVYRGRGASAGGGAARAVWLLIPDPVTPGLSTLRCVKVKGEAPPEIRLQLGADRWMTPLSIEVPKAPTLLERILEVVDREMKTATIKAALSGFSGSAVEAGLTALLQSGSLRKIKHGVYAPAKTTETPETPMSLFGVSGVSVVFPDLETTETPAPIGAEGTVVSAGEQQAMREDLFV